MASRLGITARVTEAEGYSEPRDALAQDWPRFLRFALPEVVWLMIPNVGARVQDFVEAWKLEGFIFSGGGDLGESTVRDETERRLLEYAVERDLPAFGICRGLQLLQKSFGGSLRTCDPAIHTAKRHEVHSPDSDFPSWARAGLPLGRRGVNSFHGWGICRHELAHELSPFALTEDGGVEGAYHLTKRVGAVMWHPEREHPFAEEDATMIRGFFRRP